jgi:uncharacterized Fe-S cluster protein YjdI
MDEKEIVKEYSNGDLTVIWKPKKCIHSGICVKTLPDVYDPKGRPWIKPENASRESLISQIDTCPSGALSYRLGNSDQKKKENGMETKVEVIINGPLLVRGNLEVTTSDGAKEIKKRSTAFCRCGSSANKPYCDGTHNTVEFKG